VQPSPRSCLASLPRSKPISAEATDPHPAPRGVRYRHLPLLSHRLLAAPSIIQPLSSGILTLSEDTERIPGTRHLLGLAQEHPAKVWDANHG